MANSINPALYLEALRLKARYDNNHIAAGKATRANGGVGITRATFGERLRDARFLFPEVEQILKDDPEAEINDADYIPQIMEPNGQAPLNLDDGRQQTRLQDRIKELEKQKQEAYRALNDSEDLRASLFGLREPLDPAKLNVNPHRGKNPLETPILFTSDFQWGEVIDLEEMAGLNCFDKEIASARYSRLIETFIDLTIKSNSGRKPKEVIYLRGGDSISGEIHDELAQTNDLWSLPAVKDLARHEIAGIERIVQELGCKVKVISVPGNHGRQTRKPMAKKYVETNYDDLCAWAIEMYFNAKGNTDVSFYAPKSGDALFEVHGLRFCMTHGDRIGSRGGQGFVGPAATIARGMKKLSDYYAGLNQHIDYFLVGHFHTPLKLEHGFSNGSLPGLGEYARDLRVKPAAPVQWYFSVHPTRGIVEQREIMVGGAGEGSLCEPKE